MRTIPVIDYILCAVIVLQTVLHRLERRDLYNRIMSRSYAEYDRRTPRSGKTAHERILEEWRGKGGRKT